MSPMRKVDIPLGESGGWHVEQFTVSRQDADMHAFMSSIRSLQGRPTVAVPAGTYTRLVRDGTLVMSDTPSEMQDHAAFVRRAAGRVFIAGLGIGMVLQAVLDKPGVTHATVLELSWDVINLVAPTYRERYGDRVEIVQGDVHTYTPPRGTHLDKFDAAWFDVWDTKCSDNLPGITKIKRRWARWAKWRGVWAEELIRSVRGRYWA